MMSGDMQMTNNIKFGNPMGGNINNMNNMTNITNIPQLNNVGSFGTPS